MKFKLYSLFVIVIGILSVMSLSFAESDRLVHIPVPPNSTGYADFTEEEAVERAREYEESKNNTVTADYYVGKSSEIEGKNLRGLAEKIEAYIEFLKNNQEFETNFYDVGDGLSVSVKKNE